MDNEDNPRKINRLRKSAPRKQGGKARREGENPSRKSTNVTERKRIEEALKESEAKFRAIFDHAHDGILISDTEAKRFYIGNGMICTMLGYSQEELKNLGVSDIHLKDDMPEIMEKFKAVVRNELALTKGLRVKRKDGSIFYADIGASPVTLHGKDYVIGIFRDVTERKQVEEEKEKLLLQLRDALEKVSLSKKEWQDTFDNITDLLSVHDRDFNIIKVNKAFAEHFCMKPDELINRKCYHVFHGSNLPVPNCPHRQTLREASSVTEEVHDPKSGRTFRVSTFPYYSSERILIGSIHIARDITSEREKELHLIVSERLAALGQMAAGIAHEINNPLASIAGCTEGLLNRVKKGKFEAELFENYLRMIKDEILRCKDITGSMLSFVRKNTYEKKEIHIHDTINKTLEIIGFQGRLQEFTLIRNFCDKVPVICGSEGDLRQVLLAIITNALDAMEGKGTLTLETGVETDDNVFIKISDTGPGIPPENIERIFKPFFTTKAEKGGTGLGLSIANKIISSHNGSINVVTSIEGKGTTFKITLPV